MTAAPLQPGDLLLDKYRVERHLGQGGMGLVVAARHLALDELHAIKVLLPQAIALPQAVERFIREARAAARLKGEHVAKVHDVGRLPTGQPYMVMEYLNGADLKSIVDQRGAMPLPEVVHHLLQVCEALAEAHALGIVHRDLKPANLFLVRRPNGASCVKVLDFGISKQTTLEGAELTQTHSILGSPLYMAPEQMVRSKGVDLRADIWAMGVVLYELTTGKTPFLGDTITEVVARVLQERHAPATFVRAGLPRGLDAVIERCLAKRPEDRFASMDELAVALRGLVADTRPLGAAAAPAPRAATGPHASPPGTPEARPAAPRRLVHVAVLGTTLLLGAIVVGAAFHLFDHAPGPPAASTVAPASSAESPIATAVSEPPAESSGAPAGQPVSTAAGEPSAHGDSSAGPSIEASGGEPTARPAPSSRPALPRPHAVDNQHSSGTTPVPAASLAPPVTGSSTAPTPPKPSPSSPSKKREGVL